MRLGFAAVDPEATERPSYHPAILLKLYIYLNRVQPSRRLESEARRNVEVMWLLGRLAPRDGSSCDGERRDRWQQVQSRQQLGRFDAVERTLA